MKETENLSIGGYAFTLEKEAAAAVSAYLEELGRFYSSAEIMEGIEERMAELLLEKAPEGCVVTPGMVQNIIEILGRPERLEAEDASSDGSGAGMAGGTGASGNNSTYANGSGSRGGQAGGAWQARGSSGKPRKKLYRDPENARIAGVCSGLSLYTGIDVALLRLIVLVLFVLTIVWAAHGGADGAVLLIVPLCYLLMCIAVPKATTARQRWEQRGEDGSVNSIIDNINEGGRKAVSAIGSVGRSPVWGTIGRVLEVGLGLLLLLIAAAGLTAGAIALFGLGVTGLDGLISEATLAVSQRFAQFPGLISLFWVKLLAAAVYFLPFIGMLYVSILMLFHFKSPRWRPGLWIFVIWLICLVAAVVLFFACFISAETVL